MSCRPIAVRWIGRLVRAYPRSFPSALSDDLVEVFEAEYLAASRRGRLAAARLTLATSASLVFEVVRERIERRTGRRVGRAGTVRATLGDLRYAILSLRASPGHAAAVVVCLALGLGANVAIFGLAEAVLIDQNDYVDRDRVVLVTAQSEERGLIVAPTEAMLAELLSRTDLLARVEASASDRPFWPLAPGGPRKASVRRSTPGLPQALGMEIRAGRPFHPDEGRPDGPKVALMNEGLWREAGASLDVVGSDVVLDEETYRIVGVVAPSNFAYERIDFWVASHIDPGSDRPRDRVWAWLAPGVGDEAAREELRRASTGIELEPVGRVFARIERPYASWRRSSFAITLYLFWGAATCLLLVMCANLAGLWHARTLGRRRELAVRSALGARPHRLVRQLLFETLVLSALGAVGGLIAAVWGIRLLLALRPESLSLVYPPRIPMDPLLAAYGVGLGLLVGLVFGVGPALRAAHRPVKETLRGEPSPGRTGRMRWASWTLGFQAAFTLLVVIVAGLLLNSFVRLVNRDPGFRAEGLQVLTVEMAERSYPEAGDRVVLLDRLVDRLAALDSTEAVAWAQDLPPHDTVAPGHLEVEGRATDEPPPVAFEYGPVRPGYFRVMGIRLLEGELPPRGPVDVGDLPVAVSRSIAGRYWPNDSPLGARFRLRQDQRWMRIVGVVEDVTGMRGEWTSGQLYVPIRAESTFRPSVVLRTRDGNPVPVDLVQEIVWSLDPELPIVGLESMETRITRMASSERFGAALLSVFAIASIGLAALGIFAATAYRARQRTHELGVRLALGARPEQLVRLMVRQGLVPTAGGLSVGLLGAWAASGLLGSQVHGIEPTDLPTYAGSVVFFAVVALAAAWLPAMRAVKADPARSLRPE